MVIVIRAIQAVLLLAALCGAVAATVMGVIAYDDVIGRCIEGNGGSMAACSSMPRFQVQVTAAVAIGIAGVVLAVAAGALNGMARRTKDTGPQVGAVPGAYGHGPQHPQQPVAGPHPYGAPRG